MKELTESASVAAFRARFEAGRSFDLDDDLEFCPDLLTEEEVIHSPLSPAKMRDNMFVQTITYVILRCSDPIHQRGFFRPILERQLISGVVTNAASDTTNELLSS